jgi:hypothetical protein
MDDPRIVELLTEMLQEQKQMKNHLGHMGQLLGNMDHHLGSMDQSLGRLEKQQQITNLRLDELTLSHMKLGEAIRGFTMEYGERIVRLEAAVFH